MCAFMVELAVVSKSRTVEVSVKQQKAAVTEQLQNYVSLIKTSSTLVKDWEVDQSN